MTRQWLENNDLENIKFNLDFIPKINDRRTWSSLHDRVKRAIIKKADEFIEFEFCSIPATAALAFTREGDRQKYESASFIKRDALALLVLAECIEDSGRYTDSIINGIWSICEESFWGISAHMDGCKLPDVKRPVVDLFAAQSANLLFMTKLLLGDRLNNVTEILTQRIDCEIERRITTPFLERTDWGWMGFTDAKINNWNPWILSNILPIFIGDYISGKDKSLDCIKKAMHCLYAFINEHSQEGSCDEGCSYWGEGALSMFDFLEFLYLSSDGEISFFDDKKINNMLEYIFKVYIGGNAFVNFADASPYPHLDILTIFRMGSRLKNEKIKSFARNLFDNATEQNCPEYITLRRHLFDIFVYDEFINYLPEKYDTFCFYMSDIQVLTARQNDLFIAFKGGNNDENHNHNDVGNFIVCYKNKPVFIDIGVGVYTKQTFSNDRYSIFTMQSSYHNLPDINGVQQRQGSQSRAYDFDIGMSSEEISASMDLDSCYDGERLQRHFDIFDEQIVITDCFDNADVSMNFILSSPVTLTDKGFVCSNLELRCNKNHQAKIEAITLTDSRLQASWGDEIYRVIFKFENACNIQYIISAK